MARKKALEDRERMAASLAASLPDSGGDYQISFAFSAPERQRFMGAWSIAEHLVEGRPYIESFAASALRGAALLEPSYESTYDFREALCVKRVLIDGVAELPDGRVEYSYRMSLAASWEPGRGFILVRPELGYQSTSLGGSPAAVKELASSGAAIRIAYRFEGGSLVLEEGLDLKRLLRRSG